MFLRHDRTKQNNCMIYNNNIYLVVALLTNSAARGRHSIIPLIVALDKTNYCVSNILFLSYFEQQLCHCSDICTYIIDKWPTLNRQLDEIP